VGVGSVVGAGQALAQSNAPAAITAPASIKPVKIPTRKFGRTGVPVSMLALGGIFDIESNQLVLKQALDWGVTYWDTAASYNGGRSEGGIGMYLEKNPQVRRDIFLATKSHEGGQEEMTKALNQSLERLKTDYIDLYFVHGLNDTSKLNDDTKAWVAKAKADKKIRFFGFSTHKNMESCLQEAAKLGWIDGIMLKYDFSLMHTDAMKAAMDAATQAGIGLTAMKTQNKSPIATETEADLKLGGHFIQRGFTQPQAKIKAVWENPQIASICSQMPNLTVIQSNIAAALDKTSLTAADHAALREYAVAALRRLRAILRSRARPSGAGGRRDARAHVSPQLRRPGAGADGVPPIAGSGPSGAGRIRLCGGGTGVSARPAHRAMDAGSGRTVRVILGDFVTEAGSHSGLGFLLPVLVP
jgi:hypothetical protein